MGKEDLRAAINETEVIVNLEQFITTLFDQDVYDILSDYDYRLDGHFI